jgi:hypothetical protein
MPVRQTPANNCGPRVTGLPSPPKIATSHEKYPAWIFLNYYHR